MAEYEIDKKQAYIFTNETKASLEGESSLSADVFVNELSTDFAFQGLFLWPPNKGTHRRMFIRSVHYTNTANVSVVSNH